MRDVSCGMYGCCAVLSTGALTCWGDAAHDLGQLEPPSGRYVQVAVGMGHACAVRTPGLEAVCWGANDHGQATPPDPL